MILIKMKVFKIIFLNTSDHMQTYSLRVSGLEIDSITLFRKLCYKKTGILNF